MKITICALGALALSSTAGTASATTWVWDWVPGDPGFVNNAGGEFESVTTTYDDATSLFTFDLAFADQITDGFTLVVSPGPNPKGHAGELAILYVDGTGAGNPEVTAYAYNGENTHLSWADGSPLPGVQNPDKIATTQGVNASDFLSVTQTDSGAGRVFSLTLDASTINGHTPAYPGPGGPGEWTGVAFAQEFGIWLHPAAGLTTSYGTDGFLTDWKSKEHGWLDGSYFQTVPTPAGAAVLAMGGLACVRRRRA